MTVKCHSQGKFKRRRVAKSVGTGETVKRIKRSIGYMELEIGKCWVLVEGNKITLWQLNAIQGEDLPE